MFRDPRFELKNEDRKHSVFDASQRAYFTEIGSKLWSHHPSKIDSSPYRNILGAVDPEVYRQAVAEVRELCSLFLLKPGNAKTKEIVGAQVKQHPDFAFLFCFDSDGYSREIAIKNISGPLKSPFEVITLIDACNNWVEVIRTEATNALRRCLGATHPVPIAKAFAFVVGFSRFWQRWEPTIRDEVMNSFFSDAVIGHVVDMVVRGQFRKPSAVMKLLLSRPSVDPYLLKIWREAQSPPVRAKALKTLCYRKAEWRTGYEDQWINKPLGLTKRVASISQRPIATETDLDTLLTDAVNDKYVVVRRTAAQAIIDLFDDIKPETKSLISLLLTDDNNSIRSRGEFANRRLQSN